MAYLTGQAASAVALSSDTENWPLPMVMTDLP
jgi:hypothetical protein